MDNEITFGKHRARYESPDTLLLDWRGTLEADDIAALTRFTADARERAGVPLFLIVDAGTGGGLSASARKGIVDLARRKYWHATLCHGAEFKLRVLIELIVNAVNLVAKEQLPLVFVDSESAARSWVQSRRAG